MSDLSPECAPKRTFANALATDASSRYTLLITVGWRMTGQHDLPPIPPRTLPDFLKDYWPFITGMAVAGWVAFTWLTDQRKVADDRRAEAERQAQVRLFEARKPFASPIFPPILPVRVPVPQYTPERKRFGGGRRRERACLELLELWLLASVAGAFEPKDRYGARVRTGQLRGIESV
jgi:hypothetical protein